MPEPIVPPETPTPESSAPDLSKVADSLVAKHGSAESAIRDLVSQNYKERDKNRELTAKLPPAGSVILSSEEAKAWEAYRSLGSPAEVRKLKTEHGDLTEKNESFVRKEVVAEFGKKAGVPTDKIAALTKLVTPGLVFGTETKKENGKDLETVTVKDGDAEPVAFDLFFAEFLPALKPDAETVKKPLGTPRHETRSPRPPERTESADHGSRPPAELQLLRSGRYAGLR